MIKQNQNKLNIIHTVMDLLISAAATVAAYFETLLIFNFDLLSQFHISLRFAAAAALGIALIQIICNKICDLYRSYRSASFSLEIINIIRSGLIVFLLYYRGLLLYTLQVRSQKLPSYYEKKRL